MNDMVQIVGTNYSNYVGREELRIAHITADRAAALASTLDLDIAPGEGDRLPPSWHWLYFNGFVKRDLLGHDGHPKTGGFLPDVGLPRRMWAGGRLRYLSPIIIGTHAERVSKILSVTPKTGKMGELVFVNVQHTISSNGVVCIEEEQDIVYREAPPQGSKVQRGQAAPDHCSWSESVSPDPVLLFRYSSLTSNGHRIHYDSPYAKNVEGYPDLVVHGPLISSLLHGLAVRARPQLRLTGLEFRAVAPLFVNDAFKIEAAGGDTSRSLRLWAKNSNSELAMTAEATFA